MPQRAGERERERERERARFVTKIVKEEKRMKDTAFQDMTSFFSLRSLSNSFSLSNWQSFFVDSL